MNDNIRGCVVIKVLRHSLFSDLYGRAVLFFRRNIYCVFAFVDGHRNDAFGGQRVHLHFADLFTVEKYGHFPVGFGVDRNSLCAGEKVFKIERNLFSVDCQSHLRLVEFIDEGECCGYHGVAVGHLALERRGSVGLAPVGVGSSRHSQVVTEILAFDDDGCLVAVVVDVGDLVRWIEILSSA